MYNVLSNECVVLTQNVKTNHLMSKQTEQKQQHYDNTRKSG